VRCACGWLCHGLSIDYVSAGTYCTDPYFGIRLTLEITTLRGVKQDLDKMKGCIMSLFPIFFVLLRPILKSEHYDYK